MCFSCNNVYPIIIIIIEAFDIDLTTNSDTKAREKVSDIKGLNLHHSLSKVSKYCPTYKIKI